MTVIVPDYADAVLQRHKLAVSIASALEAVHFGRNCLTCQFFLEPMEMCEKFSQRPPARIIAYGCDQHSDMIPF